MISAELWTVLSIKLNNIITWYLHNSESCFPWITLLKIQLCFIQAGPPYKWLSVSRPSKLHAIGIRQDLNKLYAAQVIWTTVYSCVRRWSLFQQSSPYKEVKGQQISHFCAFQDNPAFCICLKIISHPWEATHSLYPCCVGYEQNCTLLYTCIVVQ